MDCAPPSRLLELQVLSLSLPDVITYAHSQVSKWCQEKNFLDQDC